MVEIMQIRETIKIKISKIYQIHTIPSTSVARITLELRLYWIRTTVIRCNRAQTLMALWRLDWIHNQTRTSHRKLWRLHCTPAGTQTSTCWRLKSDPGSYHCRHLRVASASSTALIAEFKMGRDWMLSTATSVMHACFLATTIASFSVSA